MLLFLWQIVREIVHKRRRGRLATTTVLVPVELELGLRAASKLNLLVVPSSVLTRLLRSADQHCGLPRWSSPPTPTPYPYAHKSHRINRPTPNIPQQLTAAALLVHRNYFIWGIVSVSEGGDGEQLRWRLGQGVDQGTTYHCRPPTRTT